MRSLEVDPAGCKLVVSHTGKTVQVVGIYPGTEGIRRPQTPVHAVSGNSNLPLQKSHNVLLTTGLCRDCLAFNAD